ncbi:cyclin-L1-1-like isoform X1 [Camellia sinensis]|uniref:cyclin-L1-1-like isoform X1 n=1 Tax=Camellia sinensis TaxID=4442 RepID=UPI001036C46C|nr:cyclin-L1-1-like isoform X1 [Camellia sinensis]XP_028061006.1 cyclin-L1-1-like isoform X1 [Camellia sinensis]XP_028061007.1 cyclin-L1-1-like isoform X1 [Camellia sinensis]XP_028061008.1 cyclin-L1-1-like isoform X1 [Camellia sinensis]XP_028061009.1 cyclin-L1-1-like isoform X1 [Camellia sinensis]XP_028061010.1 cyclin-L1-1-like isoform X1 [Camellia sinensis]XP_028061011.1 cyclin-L1-1-like isoform X1 [Camellia sinensis]XP_028061012.1 cyclin-L1-1-like isoform X1 [Camellia sinensis]XP_02806101
MIYTAIDTFYLTDEQLQNSPSRKDGIDEATETTLRIYGCDLIQESGILLKLPQAVMATGQVLFHRFYCKKSFARFNVKRVAASCVWLASKLEESPRKARQVLIVFHRMECRRENLPIEHLDTFPKKYAELKMDLNRTERHLLKEMGFICHVEHPHKFISNYLAALETPPELRQEAWNLANDSLRTTLCVRFKSEVVACGVVYAAARRFQVPLPENPPWWKAFDADKSGIDEVCRVLAHLYSLPKAKYIPVCKDGDSFTTSNKSWDSPSQPVPKEGSLSVPPANNDTSTPKAAPATANLESGGSKGALIKAALDKLKESKKSGDDSESVPVEAEAKEEPVSKLKSERKMDASGERNKERDWDRERDREREKERDRDREREKDRLKVRDRDRGRDSDREREREDIEREREKVKDRDHRSKDKGKDSGGHSDKSKHHSSRASANISSADREYHGSSYSRDKDRHRHH